jgi:hypothetical protein
MKKKLEEALEHARKYYKLYTGLPVEIGWFGAGVIQKSIYKAEQMLKDFDNHTIKEVKELTKELESIE